jgi:Transcriptional regulators
MPDKNASPAFTEKERAILRIAQKTLPDCLEPYAAIAAETGTTEEEVLALLQQLKDSGAVRRFGASLKHQKAGFTENAMVAWKKPAGDLDAIGRELAKHPMISHCYYRPSVAEDWPYEVYTMIHGTKPGDCEEVIQHILETTPLTEYARLKSIKELKKISMTYF